MENLTTQTESTEVQYAGFWLRFVAFLVDGLIIKIAHAILFTPLFLVLGLSSLVRFGGDVNKMDHSGTIPSEMLPLILTLLGGIILALIFSLIMFWLYYALMESSAKQATLGKMILNLKVTDMNGGRISFVRASGRLFGKVVSSMTMCIGYIMAGFTAKKQALHDIMADCLVVKK